MERNERIINKLLETDLEEVKNLEMLFSMAVEENDYFLNKKVRKIAAQNVNKFASIDTQRALEFRTIYKKTLLLMAKDDFDSYLQYVEFNRQPAEKFYMPRRKVLLPLVEALQDLADDKLDELFLSQPPRTGKTAMLNFFATWIIGRNSEASNLYCSYSDGITRTFYNGVLEIITDPNTYLWGEVFAGSKIANMNSKDETLSIDRRKKYSSLTCRPIDGSLNGACDCNGIEINDDLVEGIEEAMNKDRLIKLWAKVDNNLLPRAKEKAKILWCGTRWSNIDPIGVRLDLLQNDERYKSRRIKVINLPALAENDESNFGYDFDVGFSSEFYQQRRASFERNNDMASWNAQYMGEPIEREGALFSPSDFRYYNGVLPKEEPDRIFMAVDPAWGGGDYVASPVCYQYGEDIYVHDVVYDKGDKTITQPKLAKMAIKNNVQAMQVEANKTTESYKEGIELELKKDGHKINLTTKPAPTTQRKFQRIFDKAPDIRERMIFIENGKRSKEYQLFMQSLFGYKALGKNKNDDAPDSLTMAINMTRSMNNGVKIVKRLF